MAQSFTEEQKKAARKADLYDFLMRYHAADVKREGNSLRLRANHSISVKQGYAGYTDFAAGTSGNGIDLLTEYFNYSVVDAILALADTTPVSAVSTHQPDTSPQKPVFALPKPVQGQYRHLFAYLNQVRQIPVCIIQKLIGERMMYQEEEHNNIVFVSAARDFAEIRGTNSDIQFRGVVSGSNRNGFWWFKTENPHSSAVDVYICESAIDAMSLFAIHQFDYALHKDSAYPNPNNLYVSIAGVANLHKCLYIRQHMKNDHRVFLCFDNDEAGQKHARQLITEYPFQFLQCSPAPECKDWNDELCRNMSYYVEKGLQIELHK